MLYYLSLMCLATQSPVQDGDQFSRLVKGLLSDVRDYELVCEGHIRLLIDAENQQEQAKFNKTFRTRFAYRSDGWIAADTYERPTEGVGPLRRRRSILRGSRLESQDIHPDGRTPTDFVVLGKGSLGSQSVDGSPLRYIASWRWVNDFAPGADCIVLKGYESVDGHRCAVAEVDLTPKVAVGRKTIETSWIDLERGGNVLKLEHVRRGRLAFRLGGVQLSRVETPDGNSVWFPISGVFETFLKGLDYVDSPVFREEYALVQGTLRINQGLPDSRFSLKWTGSNPETVGFKEAEDEFAKAEASAPRPIRTDPVAAQKILETRVVEAERQDRQLKASTPDSRIFNATTFVQVALAMLGIAAIVVAVVLKRRA